MVDTFNSLSKIFLISLLFLSSCTMVKTEIILGDGEVITIHSKKDALVTVIDKDKTITVNNRGPRSLFEIIVTMMFTNTQLKQESLKD